MLIAIDNLAYLICIQRQTVMGLTTVDGFYCRPTVPGAGLSNILHKKTVFICSHAMLFSCPVSAGHLTSTIKTVLLAETNNHTACQSQMCADTHQLF